MSCAVKGCKNCRRFPKENVSFHVFPREDTFQKEWLKALSIDKEDWVWSKNKLVCSEHFKEEDFCFFSGRTSLRPHSMPSIGIVQGPRFPKGELQSEWLKLIGINAENWVWARHKLICSDHFEPDDFMIRGRKRFLKFNAVPSLKIRKVEAVATPLEHSEVPTRTLDATASSIHMPISTIAENVIKIQEQGKRKFEARSSPAQTSFDPTISACSKLELPYSPSAATSLIDKKSVIVIDDSGDENDTISSTVTAAEESRRDETETLFSRKRIKPDPRSFSDCSSDDMDTPRRAKVCWKIAKKTIYDLKGRVRKLNDNKRHLAQRVECLQSLMRYLEENNFLNPYASAVVKAVLPDETES